MLIDTHVHLSSFSDVSEVIKNSKRNGVDAIIAVGGDLESSVKTLEIAEKDPKFIFPGIGIHPSEILREDLGGFLGYLDENISKLVVIGEVGLDYSYPFAEDETVKERQREVFKVLIKRAKNASLPVSIHSRSAYSDALKLVLDHGPEKSVFHWYDGPLSTLEALLDEGFYVSATPALEYSKDHRLVIENTPLERILVETDSPIYLRSLKRRSEPSDVLLTLKELAKVKEQDLNETIKVCAKNALKVFDRVIV